MPASARTQVDAAAWLLCKRRRPILEAWPRRSPEQRRHRALTVPIAGPYEEAASVCLQRHRTPPVDVTLADNGSRSSASVDWESPDQQTRDAWANETDATRDGAYGCVIAGVEILREYPYLEAADIAEALSYAAWRAEEVEVPLGQQ